MKKSGRSHTAGKEAIVKTMARFSLVALFFVILTLGKIIRSRHLDSSPAAAPVTLSANSPLFHFPLYFLNFLYLYDLFTSITCLKQ